MIRGAVFVDRQWGPKQTPDLRWKWVQNGEVAGLMQPLRADHWTQWWIDNPDLVRFEIDTTLSIFDMQMLISPFTTPYLDDPDDRFLVEKRLWRFDLARLVVDHETIMGRPLDRTNDVLSVPESFLVRKAEDGQNGLLFNKSVNDVPVVDESRKIPRTKNG